MKDSDHQGYDWLKGHIFMADKMKGLDALIVANDDKLNSALQRVLKYCDSVPDQARNCVEALEKATQKPYDLILLDIHLPDGDGLDLISDFRILHPDVEIVTMTHDNPKWVESRVRHLKVTYHLIKPFEVKELISILLHTTKRKRQ